MIDEKKLNQEEQIRAYAEIYARNLIMYGVDVREKLETATQMSFALNQAYMRGKQDECHRRWIPCSERLPEKHGDYLITVIPEAGVLWTKVIIAHYSDLMGICKYSYFWTGEVGKDSFKAYKDDVIAWQPLPEPMKEE